MNSLSLILILIATIYSPSNASDAFKKPTKRTDKFYFERDLFLAYFDCWTDEAVLHSVEKFVTLKHNSHFSYDVQLCNWNEEDIFPKNLLFVNQHAVYHKTPAGSSVDKRSPECHSLEYKDWKIRVCHPHLQKVLE